ncbi:MAG: hypothetical protein Tsb002_28580 [Wenzhouxiangellaceae bacterium]
MTRIPTSPLAPLGRLLAAAVLVQAGLTLGACQSTISSLPLIHKQDILQGNVLDKDELEQVEEGMSKRQVLLVLGSPAVADPFHQDRWDYVYTLAPRGGKLIKKILTLRFEDDRLSSLEGDYLDILELAQDEAEEVQEEQRQREENEA